EESSALLKRKKMGVNRIVQEQIEQGLAREGNRDRFERLRELAVLLLGIREAARRWAVHKCREAGLAVRLFFVDRLQQLFRRVARRNHRSGDGSGRCPDQPAQAVPPLLKNLQCTDKRRALGTPALKYHIEC